jgi:ribosomal protein S18 acetylase RimI-like enzyme
MSRVEKRFGAGEGFETAGAEDVSVGSGHDRPDPKGGFMSVGVRRLTSDDAVRAAEIVRTFKGSARSSGSRQEFLKNPANYLLIAETGTEVGIEVGGFLMAYRLDRADRDASQMFVYEVGVGERWRGRGLATALVEEIIAIARREGMFEVFVLASRGNSPARKLYERTGGIVEDDSAMLFVYPLPAETVG